MSLYDEGDLWGLLSPSGGSSHGWRYGLSAVGIGMLVGVVLGLVLFG